MLTKPSVSPILLHPRPLSLPVSPYSTARFLCHIRGKYLPSGRLFAHDAIISLASASRFFHDCEVSTSPALAYSHTQHAVTDHSCKLDNIRRAHTKNNACQDP